MRLSAAEREIPSSARGLRIEELGQRLGHVRRPFMADIERGPGDPVLGPPLTREG